MAAMECREALCPGIFPVDIKWGFREFGYPMTLQNFNKSPKLESLGSLYSPLSANMKQGWLISAQPPPEPAIKFSTTALPGVFWTGASLMGVGSRKKYAWDNSLLYAMRQDKGTNQTRAHSSQYVFPRIHQATSSAQNWKMSWLGWMCVLWGQMQFILAELQQIAKLSWMRKARRVKL